MTIDDLIAFNDEVLALTRAGVPLGSGLLQTGPGLSRRLRQITDRVGAAMEQGRSLESILESDPKTFPPAYAAAVIAGSNSGNLAGALQGMARVLRRIRELRRLAVQSLSYPLIVALAACLLFLFCIEPVLEPLRHSFGEQGIDMPDWLAQMFQAIDRGQPWLWLLPVGLAGAVGVWWLSTRRPTVASGHRNSLGRWLLPGGRSVARQGRQAIFTDVLGQLLDNGVALERGLTLAAAASDDAGIQRDAARIGQSLKQGHSEPWLASSRATVPPLVGWLVRSQTDPQRIALALDDLAGGYYQQCDRTATWWRTYLPLIATVGIGGTATLIYTVIFLGPWCTFLFEIIYQIR